MSAVATTIGHHQYIPLKQLRPSPFNRKRFDKAKMDELTANVGLQGIIVPIVARPLLDCDAFEIVAGERRYRAAKAAGLVDIPAIVRDLTDAQALELQVIENGQREDVHPLEEAEGYERLMKCPKADGGTYTADDIAVKVGKSRSYVFGRLKLCALCPEARDAFYADKLDASKALLIARIGHHDTQRQALKDVLQGARDYGPKEPMSYRDAHEHILQRYMLKLSAAPFDTKDGQLLPKAGACGPCPKRTGNQADLFGDVKSADVCTDPKCFDDKRQAHYAVAVRELEAKGKKVIYGAEAKKTFPNWDSPHAYSRDEISDRYVPLSGHTYIGYRQVSVRDALGADYEPILIQHPGTGKVLEVATQQAVQAATQKTKRAGAAKAKAAKPAKPKGPDVDEMLTERLAKLIREKAPKQFARGWYWQLAKLLVQHLSTRDLEAVALAWGWKSNAFRSSQYGDRRLPAEAEKLNERDLMLLMFHLVFAIGAYSRGKVLDLFDIKEPRIREQILEERKAAAKKAREEAKAKAEASPAKKKFAKAKATAPGKKGKARQPDFMRPVQPDAVLAVIVGDKPVARTEITSKLWMYIKKNDLQDKTNRRMINADAKLLPIFNGKKQVSMFDMTKLVGKRIK